MTDLLTVTFTAANTVRGKRPYTIYEIEVRSSSTMPWLLYKRYRDFDVLHQNILKLVNMPEMKSKKIDLPSLPPKRLVRSLAPEVVARRQTELQEYLQQLLEASSLMRNTLLLDFLTVPESLRAMLMRPNVSAMSGRRGTQSESRGLSGGFGSDQRQTEETIQINQLLRELSLQKNRVRAISKFEQWYFDWSFIRDAKGRFKNRLGVECVRKLLIGDSSIPGLVQSCRLFNSKVAWRASISLLVRLLDIERNTDAHTCQEMFLSLDRGIFRQMDLHRHIHDATQEAGFQIVKLIHDNLPHVDPNSYVPDAAAWAQFEKWQKMETDSVQLKMEKPEQREEARAYNWKEFNHNHKEISQNILQKYAQLFREPEDTFKKLTHIKEKYGISCRYKKDAQMDEWKMRIAFAINHSPKDVFNFLKRGWVKNRKGEMDMWNTKVSDWKVIRQLDTNHIVYRETYKSFNTPYKVTDFTVLRCLMADSHTGIYRIVWSSISHFEDDTKEEESLKKEQLSINENRSSAIILPSGFELRQAPNNPNRTNVVFWAHMTSESVLMVSPDLLGETDELFQSMTRIEQLTKIYKQSKMRK